MHSTGNFFPDRSLEILDLFVGDRRTLSLIPYEGKHAWDAQYFHPLFRCLRDANKCIATEHRDFHLASPVAPPIGFAVAAEETCRFFFPEAVGKSTSHASAGYELRTNSTAPARNLTEEMTMWFKDLPLTQIKLRPFSPISGLQGYADSNLGWRNIKVNYPNGLSQRFYIAAVWKSQARRGHCYPQAASSYRVTALDSVNETESPDGSFLTVAT
jgi:hypothetical protein